MKITSTFLRTASCAVLAAALLTGCWAKEPPASTDSMNPPYQGGSQDSGGAGEESPSSSGSSSSASSGSGSSSSSSSSSSDSTSSSSSSSSPSSSSSSGSTSGPTASEPAAGEQVEKDGVTYTVQADGQRVNATAVTMNNGVISIPASVQLVENGKYYDVFVEPTVVRDAVKANKDTLSNVSIEASMPVVLSDTFKDCPNLQRVTLPGTLNSIMENAFSGCPRLDKAYGITFRGPAEEWEKVEKHSLTGLEGQQINFSY